MASGRRRSVQFSCKRKKDGFYVFNNGVLVWQEQSNSETNNTSFSQKKQATAETTNHCTDDSTRQPLSTTEWEVFELEGAQDQKDYISKKAKVSNQWAFLREQLTAQLVKNSIPTTFNCCICKDKDPIESIIRCPDCGPTAYFCKSCCDQHHSVVYLHLPEMWDPIDRCFKECTNNIIWKRPDKHQCISSKLTPVIVIDNKGRQHHQALETCRCKPLAVVMIEYGLWPASPTNPGVAFTFDLMLTLRSIVLEGQISLHSFCTAMQQCRPGLYRHKEEEWIKDIYRVLNWETVLNFMSVYHNVSHLQFTNIGFPDGSICQVCPEVGDNEGRRMAMDGNMNLVHRAKAGHSVRDPIHEGRFFLPQTEVDQFLSDHGDSTNPKDQNCSKFQAGSVIRSKNKTEKLDFTGTFASICNHDFPCSIFNIRHGERMAYPIFMMKSMENVKILMYDLGCQLETVVRNRNIPCEVVFGVPIFHVYGHKMSCQVRYSPRAIEGAGLFDGEGSEWLWSYLGKFRIITKEMTPENRSDLLVEALLNYGQRIELKLGISLGERLARALMLQDTTEKAIDQDLLLFPGVTKEMIEQWDKEEKELAAKPVKKDQAESWEAAYAMNLHRLFTKNEELELEEDDILEEEITKLEATIRRSEKRNKVKRRWSKTSKLYKQHLPIACEQQRMVKLAELRDAVVQYSFMVYMKSRYARGQSLAIRITKQILATSRKVNLALQAYNKIPPYGENLPHKLQRSDVSALDADIWHNLAPTCTDNFAVPPLICRKMIDTMRLNKRAEEEVAKTKKDMNRLVRSFQRQVDMLTSEIVRLDKNESLTKFEQGCLASLVRRLHDVLAVKDSVNITLAKANSPSGVNVQDFVEDVESKICGTMPAGKMEIPEVSKEAFQEMLKDILNLQEMNDLDGIDNSDE